MPAIKLASTCAHSFYCTKTALNFYPMQ